MDGSNKSEMKHVKEEKKVLLYDNNNGKNKSFFNIRN